MKAARRDDDRVRKKTEDKISVAYAFRAGRLAGVPIAGAAEAARGRSCMELVRSVPAQSLTCRSGARSRR